VFERKKEPYERGLLPIEKRNTATTRDAMRKWANALKYLMPDSPNEGSSSDVVRTIYNGQEHDIGDRDSLTKKR